MNIRPALARDLEACLALDHSFETEYVWQMEAARVNPAELAPGRGGALQIAFRVTRLPRPMRVVAAPAREAALEHYERGDCFLVAEEGGEIRGYVDAIGNPWKRLAWIEQLAIAPEQRRRGFGSSLARAALHWAHEQGLQTVLAEMPTKNYPASALLQKSGFVFCGFNDRYYANYDIALFFAYSLR